MFSSRPFDKLHLETGYKILHQEKDFLVIDKPSPLPVHPVGRFKELNLLTLLQKAFGEKDLRIVNRLDSETSGLVVAARSQEAAGKLGKLFEDRHVGKEYQAVVFGIPMEKEGGIRISLGSKVKGLQNIRVPDASGETAQTDYKVLKSAGRFSLLQITPKTGRTHQIRAHLAFIGHPIAGDKIYIDPEIYERYVREGWQEDMRAVVAAERLLLHASKLEFPHPVTGRKSVFVSEVPACFMSLMA